MRDEGKTKDDLIEELRQVRQRLSSSEARVAECERIMADLVGPRRSWLWMTTKLNKTTTVTPLARN